MNEMPVSEFKAKCIATLKEIQRTREAVVVTLRGKPLARIEPAEGDAARKRLGRLKGQMRIRCNLVRSDTTRDWEMLA